MRPRQIKALYNFLIIYFLGIETWLQVLFTAQNYSLLTLILEEKELKSLRQST